MTDLEELRDRIQWLFEPEPDDDGLMPLEYPSKRLVSVHGLNFGYMEHPTWEGSSFHKYTRWCGQNETAIHALTRNSDVPSRLFEAALRLFGDSIVAYHDDKERVGPLRFYPW